MDGDKEGDTSVSEELSKCLDDSDLLATEVADICYNWSNQTCDEHRNCEGVPDSADCSADCIETLRSQCEEDLCSAKDPAMSMLTLKRACPVGRSANMPLDCDAEVEEADECNGVTQSDGWQPAVTIEYTCPCVYTYETSRSDTYGVWVCDF